MTDKKKGAGGENLEKEATLAETTEWTNAEK